MQEELAQSCEIGLGRALTLARQALRRSIASFGIDKRVCFCGTDYYLPLFYAFLRIKVEDLGDLSVALDKIGEHGFSCHKGDLLNEAVLFLLCQEALASLEVLNKNHPLEGAGFIPDSILRDLSLKIIDGRISGLAVISGAAKNDLLVSDIIRDFHSKDILCFLAGGINGNTLFRQLRNNDIETGINTRIFPLGGDFLSVIYAFNFIIRIPWIYGNVAPGEFSRTKDYLRRHIPAFTLILGENKGLDLAALLGGVVFDLPVISDSVQLGLNRVDPGLPGSVLTQPDYKKIPAQCTQSCGIKGRGLSLDIPVPYSDAFEGERIKEEELGFELGGKAGLSCELLSCSNESDIEDGVIELFGPDIGQVSSQKRFLPLALIVDVYGKNMQKDFEPVLERQLHRFINYALGLTHEGQRDINSIRISYGAFLKGFRLKHLGLIIYSMLHKEYGKIIEKVRVRLYTRIEDVQDKLIRARRIFSARDERLNGLSDEKVDTYYSCLICQSLAPNQVCIITPQRPGMCGACSWLDAKISSEIIPAGWNHPVSKGDCLNNLLGQWDNINRSMEAKTNSIIREISLYSIMDHPQPSCGFFECILAVFPEANGVIAVDRNYTGMTPLGMDFSVLSDVIRSIPPHPGFMGIARKYILSNKFILAEGGLRRLVWMPRELKQALGKDLKRIADDMGEPGLLEKIADEEVATTPSALLGFLKEARHPALFMSSLV